MSISNLLPYDQSLLRSHNPLPSALSGRSNSLLDRREHPRNRTVTAKPGDKRIHLLHPYYSDNPSGVFHHYPESLCLLDSHEHRPSRTLPSTTVVSTVGVLWLHHSPEHSTNQGWCERSTPLSSPFGLTYGFYCVGPSQPGPSLRSQSRMTSTSLVTCSTESGE